MTADSTTQHPNDEECPPPPKNPATQPNPVGDPEDCEDLTWPTPPTYKDPDKCKPDPDCGCPTTPDGDRTCFEDLITKQATAIAMAEKAKAFKTDLEALYGKAKTAKQDYTPETYKKLLKRWIDEDIAIADLVRKLVCDVDCWDCIIECYICPLLNDLHFWEQSVYGDGSHCSDVHDLQDLLYWHTRDRDAKERTFNRIKGVLAAWEKPAATIDKVLTDNWALIEAARKVRGPEPGKAIYDVFLRLIPMHLAIAPPATTIDPTTNKAVTTRIDAKYTEFCTCATPPPEADDCCGPDIGKSEWSLRQRLIGPQPYLIDPKDYFTVVCCLVEHRWAPAKDALAEADAKVLELDAKIKKFKSQIDAGLKSFEKDAKAKIPPVIDCCDYKSSKPKDQTGTPGQTSR